MKIVLVNSGLGNQMFQYAFYKSLKNMHPEEKVVCDLGFFKKQKVHNGYELKKIFNIDLKESPLASIFLNSRNLFIRKSRKLSKKFLKQMYVVQDDVKYEEKILSDKSKKIFIGYWQSEKFFKNIEEIIRKDFKFPDFTESQNIELSKILTSSNSVSIHVRRGDYLTHPIFNTLTENYYAKAIDKIKEKIDNPLFIIFSNDIEWCKNEFKEKNIIFVSWNNGEKSYRDMQLMSLCKHNIIPNSSFSWWGAWLNNNPNKIVIAPKKWFSDESGYRYEDIIPDKWIKL